MPTYPPPGGTIALFLQFYNEQSGVLTDPDGAIQADITTGGNVGLVSDVPGGGPFFYPANITRTGVGLYQFSWNIPSTAMVGSYTVNWQVGFQGNTFLITENFYVGPGANGYILPSTTDAGFWTGSISWQPSYQSTPNTINVGTVDSDGIVWYWEKLDGWDGTDLAGTVTQRSSDHGGWPAEQFLAPRTMTWTVLAQAPNQALRDLARSKMQAAMPINTLGTFTYNEPIPKQAMVRRSGRLAETYMTLSEVEFSVLMTAPDPRKYSTTLHTQTTSFGNNVTPTGIVIPTTVPWSSPSIPPQGSMSCINAGNFETRPVITIRGPITGPQLISLTQGYAVTWNSLALSATDVLVVDMDLKQAILNGNVVYPADFNSAWWVLSPGTTEIQLGGTTPGGASITVSWRDAWI